MNTNGQHLIGGHVREPKTLSIVGAYWEPRVDHKEPTKTSLSTMTGECFVLSPLFPYTINCRETSIILTVVSGT